MGVISNDHTGKEVKPKGSKSGGDSKQGER